MATEVTLPRDAAAEPGSGVTVTVDDARRIVQQSDDESAIKNYHAINPRAVPVSYIEAMRRRYDSFEADIKQYQTLLAAHVEHIATLEGLLRECEQSIRGVHGHACACEECRELIDRIEAALRGEGK